MYVGYDILYQRTRLSGTILLGEEVVVVWWWLTEQIEEILLTLKIHVVKTRGSVVFIGVFRLEQRESLELSCSMRKSITCTKGRLKSTL